MTTQDFDHKAVAPIGAIPVPPKEGWVPGRALQRPKLENKLSNEQVDDIHYLLALGAMENLAVMRESTFRDVFLPVLACKVENEALLQEYIQGSGGFNQRVRIIDDNTGQELFTVPPVLSTSDIALSPKNDDAPTFKQISDLAQAQSHNFPLRAMENFRKNMTQRLLDGRVHRSDKIFTKEWEEIFKRYGYETMEVQLDNQTHTADAAASTVQTPAKPAAQDELLY